MRRPIVGIVGGGQLARMMLQAAIPLDIDVRVLSERADDSAAMVARAVTIGSPNDLAVVMAFATGCDVLTFDHELVPVNVLEALEGAGHVLHPSAATMAIAQNKQRQRELFNANNLPVPVFEVVSSVDDAERFGVSHGWPIVVKAATGGYDGRGVWIAPTAEDARRVVADLLQAGMAPIVEQWVAIDRELAVIVARSAAGQTVTYPPVETWQIEGICREITAPAALAEELALHAREIADRIARLTGVVGILAVELFVSEDRLLINEIATRPHNSGHFSIEGTVTSQFEEHLRAIFGWPLGATDLTAPAVVTVNVLGGSDGADPCERLAYALGINGVHLHLYGKAARPGRKLGHVTALANDRASARENAWSAAERLTGEPRPDRADRMRRK